MLSDCQTLSLPEPSVSAIEKYMSILRVRGLCPCKANTLLLVSIFRITGRTPVLKGFFHDHLS